MENLNKIFKTITISLLILLAIGITGTYLSDYLNSIDWFGDWESIETYYGSGRTYIEYHWGARHYWYNWGVFFLFLTSLVKAVLNVIKIVEDSNKEKIN